jgi:hypothetical protein
MMQQALFDAPPAPTVAPVEPQWPDGWNRGADPTTEVWTNGRGRWRLRCTRYTHESGAVVICSHVWHHRDGWYWGVRCTRLDEHLCGKESADAIITILLQENEP